MAMLANLAPLADGAHSATAAATSVGVVAPDSAVARRQNWGSSKPTSAVLADKLTMKAYPHCPVISLKGRESHLPVFEAFILLPIVAPRSGPPAALPPPPAELA